MPRIVCPPVGVLAGVVISAMTLGAVPAYGAPGLPRTYQVERVDSPAPVAQGNFGIGFVNGGDLNGDGTDDLLVGTDEHGGGTGSVFEISGKDGSLIWTLADPDPASPNPAFGTYVGKLGDLGSCPGGTNGQICPNPTVGPPDGVPDELVSALNTSVPIPDGQGHTLAGAGRVYVIDGATGAILKRLQMPAADLELQFNSPGQARTPAFGRTVLTPSGQWPCAGDMGVGPCNPANPPNAPALPTAVKVGDVTGGSVPSILVGASDFFETGATANPASPCAAAGPTAQCLQAGREYVYSGEAIAGSDPSVIDNTPLRTITNPTAQPDDPATPVNSNRENMGYSIAPVGDLGKCNGGTPGAICPKANSTGTPDGVPDFALSSHRTDDFGMFDVGVVYLIDGA